MGIFGKLFGRLGKQETLYTSMLSGSIPQTTVEIGLITAELVARNGQKKLGHEVDWGKVTYEGFQDLLLIKFWE